MRPPSKNLDTPRPVRLKSFRMSHSNQNHARLRVAMVSRRVHPAHGPGGLERHVFELVTELAARDVAVDLYSEAPADRSRLARADHLLSSVSTVSPHWVRGGWLPVGTRKGTVVVDRVTNYFIWSQRVARRLLNQAWSGAQIVHVHGLAGWGLARAARRGRLAAPLVVTTQGLEEFRSHVRLKHWAYLPFRRGMKTVAANSDAVVTTDQSLCSVVEEHLGVPEADQWVIPNAVDPERCRRLGTVEHSCKLLERHGLENAAPVFLSVGRVEANKGFERMVAALALANERLPSSWMWVLAGDGPERTQIQAAVRDAGLEPHCVLIGRIDDPELHSWYAVADWFVHPTLYEGSSLVTLEAMAHGLPVLASRTGGLPDKVEDGVSGFLVSPGDAAELAARLVDASQADAAALGAAGRRRCESRFSWNVVVPQYVSLYQQLASRA